MSGDELADLMHKALEIERGFELIAQWEGYVGVRKKEFREILFLLVSETNGHVRTLESMIEKIRTEQDYRGPPIQQRVFNFKGKNELEILTEISKIENIMLDIYSDIRDALKESDMTKILIDKNEARPFLTALENLIDDETRHLTTTSKYVRKLDRLR
ncbi:MAG: hypothetical protein JSV94_03415 [Methanobacteriota archaeon]|nr:MAG: hypothetical protein JSV94_03415 [Euryarchaeota archaeon]